MSAERLSAMRPDKIRFLKEVALNLRRSILLMNHAAGSGHPGGSLSAADIMACLFFHEMTLEPDKPDAKERDRFVLSKGHACLVLYAALAEKGFFSKDEFGKLRHINGMLQGHPDRIKTPGVEFNSGSLGQGFSFALGTALGAKYLNKIFRTYVVLGDGELDEGQVWEGLMFGAHYKLDNLLAIIDYNKLQSDDYNSRIMNLEPLVDKLKAFGWHVMEIDGHDIDQILDAFDAAKRIKGRPSVIVAHTIKGKGVSFMENHPKWHGSLAPDKEELSMALKDMEAHGE
jgi:transketolase